LKSDRRIRILRHGGLASDPPAGPLVGAGSINPLKLAKSLGARLKESSIGVHDLISSIRLGKF
jgi:hypothetical protein